MDKDIRDAPRYPFTPKTVLEKQFFGKAPKDLRILGKHADESEVGFRAERVAALRRKHPTAAAVFRELRTVLRAHIVSYLQSDAWRKRVHDMYPQEVARFGGYTEELFYFWTQRAARFGFVHLHL